jgi:hypothetical protein
MPELPPHNPKVPIGPFREWLKMERTREAAQAALDAHVAERDALDPERTEVGARTDAAMVRLREALNA